MTFELLTLAIRNNYTIEIVNFSTPLKAKMLFEGNIIDLYDEHNIDLFESIKHKEVIGICPYNDILRITLKD